MSSDEPYTAKFLYPGHRKNYVFTNKDTLNVTWKSNYVDPTVVFWCHDGKAEINLLQRLLDESSGSQLIGLDAASSGSEKCHFELFFIDGDRKKRGVNSGNFKVEKGTKNDPPRTHGPDAGSDSQSTSNTRRVAADTGQATTSRPVATATGPSTTSSPVATATRPSTTSRPVATATGPKTQSSRSTTTTVVSTTAAAATTTESNTDGNEKGLSTGAKAGVSVGAAIGGILILLGGMYLVWRAKRRRRPAAAELSGQVEKYPPPYEISGHPLVEADAVESAMTNSRRNSAPYELP